MNKYASFRLEAQQRALEVDKSIRKTSWTYQDNVWVKVSSKISPDRTNINSTLEILCAARNLDVKKVTALKDTLESLWSVCANPKQGIEYDRYIEGIAPDGHGSFHLGNGPTGSEVRMRFF